MAFYGIQEHGKYLNRNKIMNTPLISIIVPSYNQASFIENTILSIIGQSYTNWELIIQDGASKDETKEICERYSKQDKRISFFSEPDKGFADAVNKAIESVSDHFVPFRVQTIFIQQIKFLNK